MDFTTVCEVCGNSYDNYSRTFKVGDKVVCLNCWEKARVQAEKAGKFWFFSLPSFVDGGNYTLEIFDDSKSLLSRLEKIPERGDRLIGRDIDKVMTISKNNKNWWVHGYTNGLESLNLEKFEDLKGIKNE